MSGLSGPYVGTGPLLIDRRSPGPPVSLLLFQRDLREFTSPGPLPGTTAAKDPFVKDGERKVAGLSESGRVEEGLLTP